ncbi:MAG: TlpA family protein disulfide reductase [Pyrinomonadaceae bacterium]|nr:TlpA family protein disulfide reductase [Pyrinomonadaceae bacterium]
MKRLLPILLLALCVSVHAQSRRVAPNSAPTPAEIAPIAEMTVKQMFDEVNGYSRAKFTEYQLKKVPYTDALLAKTKLEQRQLAAKYAALTGGRKELSTDDLYYVGMLHWIAENLDGTTQYLGKFATAEGAPIERAQTARSIVVVVLAKQKKLAEAEKALAEYNAKEPTKTTERARMGTELAKAYQIERNFAKMAPHAVAGYEAAKALLKDSTSRARGLDEIMDAGMLVFEAYSDAGDQTKAEAALDDFRQTGIDTGSVSLYYYAVDRKFKYMVDTGRKPAATAFYQSVMNAIATDFSDKAVQNEIKTRLKKRERHYALLGLSAPEMPAVDQWFPGKPRTFSDMRGKVILLDFWATWCQPCFEAFPSLIEWHQDFKGDGLEILGVTRYYGEVNGLSSDEQNEALFLKGFRDRERLPYDFVVARGQAIQNLFGATALPTAVLIDRKGIVRYIETGTSSSRLSELRSMIIKLLAEK